MLLTTPPDDAPGLLHALRTAPGLGAWRGWPDWSDSGQDRWGVVLGLALPPLPRVDCRVDVDAVTWRGAWVGVEDRVGVALQARVRADGAAPWFLVPLGPHGPEPANDAWRGAWLTWLATAFHRLTPDQARRACPQAALAARLSGPAWALLSGRGRAGELLSPSDGPTG